jgi:hypothetical protein
MAIGSIGPDLSALPALSGDGFRVADRSSHGAPLAPIDVP